MRLTAAALICLAAAACLGPAAPAWAQADLCAALVGPPDRPLSRSLHALRDPGAATQACRAARAADPADAMTALHLARAILAADPDAPEALDLATAAQGQPGAPALLAGWLVGQLYEYGLAGLPASERQSRELYTAICADHWPNLAAAPACTALALMRIEGRGGPADETGGFNLLRNLCEAEHGPACTEAAFQGELRGDADPARVAELLARGCAAGDLLACSQYGFRLELGEGVAPDIAAARALYDLACEGGEPQGCSNLGEVYRSGLGVPPDIAAAVRYFDLGCAGHDSYACVTLGDMLAHGRGVPVDRPRARALFDQACALGDPEGCDLADSLP